MCDFQSSQINSKKDHRKLSRWWLQGCRDIQRGRNHPCDLIAPQTNRLVSPETCMSPKSERRLSRLLQAAAWCRVLLLAVALLILLMPVTMGGGTAHLRQVKQRCHETQATFCLFELPRVLNPYFITTTNCLLQVLGILGKKPHSLIHFRKKAWLTEVPNQLDFTKFRLFTSFWYLCTLCTCLAEGQTALNLFAFPHNGNTRPLFWESFWKERAVILGF